MVGLPPESVDAVVTDPAYGIKFMGKDWDGAVAFDPETWRLAFELLLSQHALDLPEKHADLVKQGPALAAQVVGSTTF